MPKRGPEWFTKGNEGNEGERALQIPNAETQNPTRCDGVTARREEIRILKSGTLQGIQGAFHAAAALTQDMGVNHCGRNVFMAEQFLDRPDV